MKGSSGGADVLTWLVITWVCSLYSSLICILLIWAYSVTMLHFNKMFIFKNDVVLITASKVLINSTEQTYMVKEAVKILNVL